MKIFSLLILVFANVDLSEITNFKKIKGAPKDNSLSYIFASKKTSQSISLPQAVIFDNFSGRNVTGLGPNIKIYQTGKYELFYTVFISNIDLNSNTQGVIGIYVNNNLLLTSIFTSPIIKDYSSSTLVQNIMGNIILSLNMGDIVNLYYIGTSGTISAQPSNANCASLSLKIL